MVNLPVIEWVEQDIAIDPSGMRDVNATGFIKLLGTAAGQILEFGNINNTVSGSISDTRLIYARASSLGDASGIFNMKFFLSSTSDVQGTVRFLESREFHFVGGNLLNESADDVLISVPTMPNYSGTIIEPVFPLGKGAISGTLEQDAGMYIYLACLANTDVNAGNYGGPGGGIRYRLMYDYT